MKWSWLVVFAIAFPACAALGIGTGDSSTSTTTGGGGTGTGIATGVSCGADPSTGEILCLGISLCPNITIDGEVYPGCGFLINGSLIDVECVCGGLLCGLGLTATCDDVQMLLSQQNEGTVCGQLSTGKCLEIAAGATSAAASSSGSSSCDPDCRDGCVGDPACIMACGC